MQLEDMFADRNPREWEDSSIKELWPSARGELLGFANALERGHSGITADQLRMAIQLADRAFKQL